MQSNWYHFGDWNTGQMFANGPILVNGKALDGVDGMKIAAGLFILPENPRVSLHPHPCAISQERALEITGGRLA